MQPDRNNKEALLAVEHLVVDFTLGRCTRLQAVSGVSLALFGGETLGLVGESGCGKSTLARAMVRLLEPSAGSVFYRRREVSGWCEKRLRRIRPEIQMIFQDAVASLNPGRTIGRTLEAPLRALGRGDGRERVRRARRALEAVGLDPDTMYRRYPFELSQGQCQRVSLARALVLNPRVLICDEPVSSLDVSVQAQILNLLEAAKRRFGLTLLFISHDLAVVKNISDRVAVMYLGKLVEIAGAEVLYRHPRHPYTRMLLAAIPQMVPRQPERSIPFGGDLRPSPVAPPAGCRFHPRCPQARRLCAIREPVLTEEHQDSAVACHFPL